MSIDKSKKVLLLNVAGVVAMAAVLTVFALWLRKSPPVEKPIIKQEAYIPPEPHAIAKSHVTFTDVTTESGIRFQHHTGAFLNERREDSRYMPETMGSGVVIFDYDGDGKPDIYVVNSADFPGHSQSQTAPSGRLYHNLGNMRFEDVTERAGLAMSCYGMGAIAADYDGDSREDLLVTSWGGPRLFRNQGNGTFREVTQEVGLRAPQWQDDAGHHGPEWST